MLNKVDPINSPSKPTTQDIENTFDNAIISFSECELANNANNGVWQGLHSSQRTANNANNENDDDDSRDVLRAIPRPTREQRELMLYGTIGIFGRFAADGKGLDPIATALSCLTWLSACISPRIVLQIGDTLHPARIFSIHVGRSSRGAKGDSSSLMREVARRINIGLDNDGVLIACEPYTGGLSSKEGIANHLHDGYATGKDDEVEPIHDKRFFVLESELGNVLSQGKREGNTLTAGIRDAFDYPCRIAPLTKGNRISSTNPHLSILGNITPNELVSMITRKDISNGLLNRFMMIYSERMENIPFPEPSDEPMIKSLVNEFKSIIIFGKGAYGYSDYDTQQGRVIAKLDDEAKDYWASVFDDLSNPYGCDLVASATERRRVFALRLALLFAITDHQTIIMKKHLVAGVEWARFSAKTAAYVLLNGLDDDQNAVDNEQLNKLIGFLSVKKGYATRTEISAECFQKHLSRKKLDAVLQLALDTMKIERKEEKAKAGGVTVTSYRIKKE